MLNNLNEYEAYGVYGDSRNTTTYVGKLVIEDSVEYEWNGTEWANLGSGSEYSSVRLYGHDYFDTGIIATNTETYEMQFRFDDIDGGSWVAIFGSRLAGPPYSGLACFKDTDAGFEFRYNSTAQEINIPIEVGTVYNIKVTPTEYIVNGITMAHDSNIYQMNTTMYVGSVNQSVVIGSNSIIGVVDYFKVYDANDRLIQDFGFTDAGGMVVMKDKLTGAIFFNSGDDTATLVGGALPKEYEVKETPALHYSAISTIGGTNKLLQYDSEMARLQYYDKTIYGSKIN